MEYFGTLVALGTVGRSTLFFLIYSEIYQPSHKSGCIGTMISQHLCCPMEEPPQLCRSVAGAGAGFWEPASSAPSTAAPNRTLPKLAAFGVMLWDSCKHTVFVQLGMAEEHHQGGTWGRAIGFWSRKLVILVMAVV